MKFNEVYQKIIMETQFTSAYGSYKINENTFQPFKYKDVLICASDLNCDINHILSRLKSRSNISYNLNDIFTITKRGIDKFLTSSKYSNKNVKSFHIISKSYPDIKVAIEIEKNKVKDMFNNSHEIYSAKYICFIFTVLTSTMNKKPLDDELLVESKNNIFVD